MIPSTHCAQYTTYMHTVCSTQLTCILYVVYNPHTCCMRCKPTAYCMRYTTYMHTVCGIQHTYTYCMRCKPTAHCMQYTTYMHTVCGIQPTCIQYAVYNPHTCCMRCKPTAHCMQYTHNHMHSTHTASYQVSYTCSCMESVGVLW